MIKVNSKVRINTLKLMQLSATQVTALEQTGEALHTDVQQAQVVPFDTGNLQNESFFVDYSQSSKGTVSLVHSTPYARRLYYHPEYNFQTKENPDAKGEWFEDWLKDGNKANWCKETFAKLYRRLNRL